MKKLLLILAFVSYSFSEVLYTDGNIDIRTCLMPKTIASIDLPCEVKELYFSNELKADVKPKAPKTIVVAIKEDKTSGSLTAVCKDTSYSFIFKVKENCESYKKVVDKRFVKKEEVDASNFSKEYIINEASKVMKGMVKGIAVRGYEIKPFKITKIVNNDDYLKLHLDIAYDGSFLVGFKGKIKNYSSYIDKQINIRKLMQKGWVMFYMDGLKSENIVLKPNEEREVFIIAIKDKLSVPYILTR